jgi:hypothetical protein
VEQGGRRKARDWSRACGERAIPAALLAAVFKLINQRNAQLGGVTLF